MALSAPLPAGVADRERYGVDVSSHQGPIDWAAVARDNIDFAYLKATEGGDFVDEQFERNWDEAHAAALDVGAYHFFTLCRPGAEQAENFLHVVPAAELDLPAALDLELAGNCGSRPSVDWVHAEVAIWLDEVERATGREVLLYVGPRFDDRYGITATFDHRLWHRRILRRPDGDRWAVWQFSYFAQVDGIEGGVDLNVLRAPEDVGGPPSRPS
ncbi:MAG: GH25 family lysozyme [Acidimicrobiales bacterium]